MRRRSAGPEAKGDELRSKLISGKIRSAFDMSTPESVLSFAIVAKAIDDWLTSDTSSHVRTAGRYLRGDMPHAVECGVDPDWIRDVIKVVSKVDVDDLKEQLEEA